MAVFRLNYIQGTIQRVTRLGILFRISEFLKPYKKQILFSWLLMLTGMIVQLVPPYLVKPLIDSVLTENVRANVLFAGSRQRSLIVFVIALFSARLLQHVFHIIQQRITAILSARILHDLRTVLYSRVQYLPASFFHRYSTGTLVSRIVRDTQSLQSALLVSIPGLFINLVTFLLITMVLLYMNWKMTIAAFLPIPIVALLSRLFWNWMNPVWKRFWEKRQRLDDSIQDLLSGIMVTKAFAQEEKEIGKIRQSSQDLADDYIKVENRHAAVFPLLTFLAGSGTLIVWWAGGTQVINGMMSVGTLLSFIFYLGILSGPLQFFSHTADWLTRSVTSAERIYAVLDETPEYSPLAEKTVLDQIRGKVIFENVSFRYEKGEYVLKDISFEIEAGSKIGVAGISGAGKSTLVQCLCRFFEASEGSIKIDGRDVREYDLHVLRGQVGVVFQENFLFNGTIAENIAYAGDSSNREAVIAAAEKAGAHSFIQAKEKGYDAPVGERGMFLSKGERQRIAIARVLFCNPAIYILDEVTGALGPEKESEVIKSISENARDKTVFFISHRLEQMKGMDRILVLKDGALLEEGSFEALSVKPKGEFKRLLDMKNRNPWVQ